MFGNFSVSPDFCVSLLVDDVDLFSIEGLGVIVMLKSMVYCEELLILHVFILSGETFSSDMLVIASNAAELQGRQ